MGVVYPWYVHTSVYNLAYLAGMCSSMKSMISWLRTRANVPPSTAHSDMASVKVTSPAVPTQKQGPSPPYKGVVQFVVLATVNR